MKAHKPDPQSIPWLKSFARRKGRSYSEPQARLMETLWPGLSLDPHSFSLASLFPTPKEALWLEIGFGSGEYLTGQAKAHPKVGVIGCEPYMLGVARALEYIDEMGLTNIRLYNDDARFILEKLPEACLDRVFILFPDPWRKTRHYKRRIVSEGTLTLLARVMKPGAELRLVTDHADYGAWMITTLMQHKDFEWTARSKKDWQEPPEDWIETRYQQKAALEGRHPVFLIARRKG